MSPATATARMAPEPASRPAPHALARHGSARHGSPQRHANSDAAGDWLAEVNRYRAASGLPAVTSNPAWDQGLLDHLTYLEDTPLSLMSGPFASMHTENPASHYYTPAGAVEAAHSDLISVAGGQGPHGTNGGGSTPISPLQAIDGWLSAPFHAIGILRAQLHQVALATSGGDAGLDILRGLNESASPAATPILFPGPGMVTNLTRLGNEYPSPVETCNWKENGSGLPLIAMLPSAPEPGLSASVTAPDGSTDTPANGQLCLVDEHTYHSSDPVYGPTGAEILKGDQAVLLVPRQPLSSGTWSATITQPNAPAISWSFTVASRDPASVTTIEPSVLGRTSVGSALVGEVGPGATIASVHTSWLRCSSTGTRCIPIPGADHSRYVPTAADAGHTLRFASGPGSESQATAPIAR
jgi:hypothetical protein